MSSKQPLTHGQELEVIMSGIARVKKSLHEYLNDKDADVLEQVRTELVKLVEVDIANEGALIAPILEKKIAEVYYLVAISFMIQPQYAVDDYRFAQSCLTESLNLGIEDKLDLGKLLTQILEPVAKKKVVKHQEDSKRKVEVPLNEKLFKKKWMDSYLNS